VSNGLTPEQASTIKLLIVASAQSSTTTSESISKGDSIVIKATDSSTDDRKCVQAISDKVDPDSWVVQGQSKHGENPVHDFRGTIVHVAGNPAPRFRADEKGAYKVTLQRGLLLLEDSGYLMA
jgi:hypothetical protein